MIFSINCYHNHNFIKGYGAPVSVAPTSPTKKQLPPDHPNPALPITEV